jgi:hypothetical protein
VTPRARAGVAAVLLVTTLETMMTLMTLTTRSLPSLLAATLGLGACDAMTDGGYPGEPQVSLRGTVEDRRTTTTRDDVKLYLLWQGNNGVPNIGVEVAVEPKFPVQFKLDVFEQPEVIAAITPVDPHVPESWGPASALGDFIAARPGTDFRYFNPAALDWHPQAGMVGADLRHWLYYFDGDVGADTLPGLLFHGPQTRGFHLMERRCIGPEKAAQITACLAQFPPKPWPNDESVLTAALEACGSVDPKQPWLERAANDLDTEITVELIDDLAAWKPDPSECL